MMDTRYVEPTRPVNYRGPREEATLIVGGINFKDWETVWVQLRWTEAYPLFRFSSVERDTPPGMFQKIQFLPGARCKINLGGVDVVDGLIETRQVAYDANRHGVELVGTGYNAAYSRSSVHTKTGSFDGMSFQQVAEKVLSAFPVGIKIIGTLNPTPFDALQNQPGEKVWDFLERIARPRGILLGSDSFGNFLLIGNHQMPVVNSELIEGQNIKTMQCMMQNPFIYAEYDVTAQTRGTDQSFGSQANELEGSWGGTGLPGSILITPAEQPVKSIGEVVDRAKNEALWHEGTKIEATVTVQGWYRDDVNLWWPGSNVYVNSPMCPLQMVMKIATVTFTQDSNSGTQTQLDLKAPWALLDDTAMNVGPVQNKSIPSIDAPLPVPPGQNIPPI
jgi:prophage tail gpP-like protein